MSLDSAKTRVLDALKERGRLTRSALRRLLDGDAELSDEVAEELVLDGIARAVEGGGLLFLAPGEGQTPQPQSPARKESPEQEPALVPAVSCADAPVDPPAPTVKLRIFLSYGHDEHAALAQEIKRVMEARGHTVWFDVERLKPGGEWECYIEDGLDWAGSDPATGRVVVVMTPHSMRRPDGYCLNELARAIDRRLDILPVMAVLVEPPLSIARLQWLDLQDCLPVAERGGRLAGRLHLLTQALEEGRTDFEGTQARVLRVLKPLAFDVDLQQHLPRFTGRKWMLEAVAAWLCDEKASRVFWILGGAGVGKTALSTYLCANRREVAAFHLCRFGHDQKGDPRHAVRSIVCQLATQLPEYLRRLGALKDLEELAGESNAQTLFERLVVQPLHQGFPKPDRAVVILIDGLDEATRDGRNELAEFLGHQFANLPVWVRMILTSRPEPEVMTPLQGLEPIQMRADAEENLNDLREFLRRELAPHAFGGQVPEKLVEMLVERSEGVFLYAEWVRQEIAAGRLSLAEPEAFPRGLGAVYLQFFQRRFPQVTEYKRRFRPALEAVAAAREPLAMEHLASLLAWSSYDRKEIPEAFGALLPALEGRVRLFHRTAVDWLTNEGSAGPFYVDVREGHARLAGEGWDAFQKGGTAGLAAYARAHLPAHLAALGRWHDLVKLLTDLEYFVIAWKRNEDDVKAWFVQIKESTGKDTADVFRALIQNPDGALESVGLVAQLLNRHGLLENSLKLYDWIECEAKAAGEKGMLSEALRWKAHSARGRGEIDAALALYRESQAISLEIGDMDRYQLALGGEGWILHGRGELDAAITLCKKRAQICRDHGLNDGLYLALGAHSEALRQRGDLDGSLVVCRETERICRELGSTSGLQDVMNRQAVILKQRGDFDGAMILYREQERIYRQLGDRVGLQMCLGNQGNVLSARGDLDGAMTLFKEQERICRELGRRADLENSLVNQACSLAARGDLNGAMDRYKEAEQICRELGSRGELRYSLGNRAGLLLDADMPREALPLLHEVESLCLELRIEDGATTCCYSNLGLAYAALGENGQALEYHKKSEALCRKTNRPFELARGLGYQASIQRELGEKDQALALYREQERMLRELKTPQFLIQSLANQAIIHADDGDTETALPLLKEAHELAHKHGYQDLEEKLERQLLSITIRHFQTGAE